MLSGELVHLIETHWGPIMDRVAERIRCEPEMEHLRPIIAGDAGDWGRSLLSNLGHWMLHGEEHELETRFVKLGRIRCEDGVPLDESVRCLCAVRQCVVEYVDEHILNKSTMELYAESELNRRLSRFFDVLMVSLVRGYEKALRATLQQNAARATH
jgi:hypothetical protein